MSEETPRRPVYDRAARWYAHSAWVQKGSGPLGGRTLFARRSVRRIFRHVRAATKNDSASFRRHRRRKPGRGSGPFLDFSQDGRATLCRAPGTEDGGPRSAACFFWKCLLSGSPRSGFAGGRAAAAAGRGTRGRARTLRCAPGTRGRAHALRCAPGTRDGRRETRDGRRGTGDEGRETGDEGWGRIIPRFPVHTGWEREGIP